MSSRGSGAAGVYRVHGMMQSYFTRKMTGYLDYKGIPWMFRRFPGTSPEADGGGLPGRRAGRADARPASSCGTRRP